MATDPPFSIADILAGVLPIGIVVHLGELVAVKPYQLATLVEADFTGYQAAPLNVSKRQEYQGGYGYLEGSARFQNGTPDTTVNIASAWLTAIYPESSGNAVLLVVLPPLTEVFPPGSRTFTIKVGCFQQEEVK